MVPITLRGVDQYNVLLVLRTSFLSSMDLSLFQMMMILTKLRGKGAIILYSLGSLLQFLIQLHKLLCFKTLLLRFGKISRNVFLRLIVLDLQIYVPPLTISNKVQNLFWNISLNWKLCGRNFILTVLSQIALVLFHVDVLQCALTKSIDLRVKSFNSSLASLVSFWFHSFQTCLCHFIKWFFCCH